MKHSESKLRHWQVQLEGFIRSGRKMMFILVVNLCQPIMRFITALCLGIVFGTICQGQNFNLGQLKDLKDQYAPELDLKEKLVNALDKTKDDYDEVSFNYAISFSDNAGLFEVREKYEKHRSILTQIITSEDEKKPLEKADQLNETGAILYASNKFNAARLAFSQALEIYIAEGETDDEPYALLQSNRALLFHSLGRYTKAEALSIEALKIRENKLFESAAHGVSLNNIGVLKKDLGLYGDAERTLEQALDIIGKKKGKESVDYSIVLNNQAMLFQVLGRYEEAEEKMETCLSIAEKTLKVKSGNYVKLKINLAILYKDMGRLDEAIKIYEEAIALKKKRLGTWHPDYAHLQRGLAAVYLKKGENEEVEKLLSKAASIYKRKFGEEHPAYASTISELGTLYRIENRLNEAEPLLNQALEVRSSIYGATHMSTVEAQENLALLKWQAGQISESAELYGDVITLTLDFVNHYFSTMSDQEKSRFWDQLHPRLDRFNSFVVANNHDRPELLTVMYNTHLQTKALLLNAHNKVKKAILSSGDDALIVKYNEWLDLREELSRLYTLSKDELKEEGIDLSEIERESNTLEKELTSGSDVFSKGYGRRTPISVSEIREVLTEGEAALEIVDLKHFDVRFTGEIYYAGLILHKNTQIPQIVLKTNGKELDSRYIKFYRNAIKYMETDDYSYPQFWGGLDKTLEGIKTVYCSLDGVYNQINMNTLRNPETKEYLIDNKDFVLVMNTKDVVALKKTPVKLNLSSTTLFGFPDYGSGLSVSEQRSGSALAALPGTKVEVNNIKKALQQYGYKSQVYLGESASEEHIKDTRASIIHIATHGFFLEDVSTESGTVFGIEVSKAQESALHRSGLMLSGAQKTILGKDVDHSSSNNGILTAYETMNLDLDKTDLIVLSACETGLGDVKVGEGVYGLQRAFQIAGAKSIIMSLWKVSDEATEALMTSFYKELAKTKNHRTAFLNAQKKLRARFDAPYYWGAFIMIGQ